MSSNSRSPSATPSKSSVAPPDPPSEVYLAHLHDHISTSRLYTLGGEPEDDPLPPSVFPPSTHWTSKEKNLFFHGLAVHSRLRPDLIAHDIKTKTLMDVCVYLDMLEEGLENLDGVKEQGPPSTNRRSRRKVKEFIRDDLPIAMEMSEQWCQFEVQQASLIAASEDKFHELWVAQSHQAELEAKRKEIRAPHGGARDGNNKRDRKGERMRGNEINMWLKEREEEWKVEERLEKLGKDDLRALDMIVRGSEEQLLLGGTSGKTADNRDNVQGGGPTERHIAQGSSSANDVSKSTEIQPIPTTFDESLIDPTLRSTTTTTIPTPVTQIPTPAVETPLPASRFRNLILQSPAAPSAEQPLAHNSDTPSPDHLLTLSPKSRRRLQKRLYMRRKRAEKTGRAVDLDPGRLKPGRKASLPAKRKGKQVTLTRGFDSDDSDAEDRSDEDEDEDEGSEGSRPRRHPHPSGMTAPYKARAELEGVGLTLKSLKDEGLDLFRFGSFHELIRAYRALDEGDSLDEMDSHISFEVLKTLQAFIVVFVYEVIKRSIMVKEQELRGKSHARVWRKRKGDNQSVHRRDVATALKHLDAQDLDRKKYYKGLLDRLKDHMEKGDTSMDIDDTGDRESSESDESWPGDGDESEDDGPRTPSDWSTSSSERGSNSGSEEPPESGSDDVDIARKATFLESISLYRRIFPPFVRLPRCYTRCEREDEAEMVEPEDSTGLRGASLSSPTLEKRARRGVPVSPRLSVSPSTATKPRTGESEPTDTHPSTDSSYSPSSHPSNSSDPGSDTGDEAGDDDEEDNWLALEDNLDFLDVEKETEYEHSLWAMFATVHMKPDSGGPLDPAPGADGNDEPPRRRKRKRREAKESSQEEPESTGVVENDARADTDTGEPQSKKPKTTRGSSRKSKGRIRSGTLGKERSVGDSLRYAPPGTGRVKSAIYVTDSD